MAGRWHDEGVENMFGCYFEGDTRPSWYLGLFTAPTSQPAITVVLSGLTEPSGGGYARIQIHDVDWSYAAKVETAGQETFSCSGAAWGNVYGWFLCTVASGTSGKLLFTERFSDGPYNVPDGGSVKITAKVTGASGT